jgi:hypothetical protein
MGSSTRAREEQALPDVGIALYQRTNGFVLGCFLALIRFRFARAGFRQHRQRMLEFLAEIRADVALPATQRAYDAAADKTLIAVVKACARRSTQTADFALLGSLCCIDAVQRLAGAPASEELRDQAVDILRRRGIARACAVYERFLAQVADAHTQREGSHAVHIDDVLGPALELLTRAIEPLRPDPLCAFVAMPFRPPYAGYYDRLYRPLAREMHFDAFRMWGGLSGEAYVGLMLAVIRRCGMVIADLSGLNANVVYEVGVARGLDKRVLLLTQRRFAPAVPANIGSDQLLLLYSPRESGWPERTVLRCAAQASIMTLAQQSAQQRVARSRRRPGEALPRLGRDDTTRALQRVERSQRQAKPGA